MSARDAFTVRRKLPAYGRDVLAARRAGRSPTGWMLVTRKWPQFPWKWTMIVPASDDPAHYDLSCCAGMAVMVSCSSLDNENGMLVGMIEAARPAVGVVIVDGEFSAWIGGDERADDQR